jgi:hypothetical protein
MAAHALVSIEPSSGVEVLPCLLGWLATEQDEELLLSMYGIIALLGAQAAEAAPLLRQHLATATEASRESILHVLRRISG